VEPESQAKATLAGQVEHQPGEAVAVVVPELQPLKHYWTQKTPVV
jgi:hypothetical protein